MENEITTSQSVPEVTSFFGRAANVFAAPGELFEEVKAAPPQTSSWLLPYIAVLLVGLCSFLVLFSNQTLREQMLESQRQDLQKQVETGKMTQEQMDRAEQMMEGGTLTEVIGSAGVVVVVSLVFFLYPALLLAILKFGLKSPGAYKKMLEVSGLSSLIGVLGSIVTVLMMFALGSIHATPGGSLLVMNSYDAHNVGHNLLASLNIFTIWQTAFVGLGLAKISGKSSTVSMGMVFGLWLVWIVIASFLGWGGR